MLMMLQKVFDFEFGLNCSLKWNLIFVFTEKAQKSLQKFIESFTTNILLKLLNLC